MATSPGDKRCRAQACKGTRAGSPTKTSTSRAGSSPSGAPCVRSEHYSKPLPVGPAPGGALDPIEKLQHVGSPHLREDEFETEQVADHGVARPLDVALDHVKVPGRLAHLCLRE